MQQCRLKKGQDTLLFEIDSSKVIDHLTGKDVTPLSQESVHNIISAGIADHSPQDITAKNIAIIVPDNTRLWARGERFVPTIIKALEGLGVLPEKVVIVIALGTHQDILPADFASLVGNYSVEKVRVVNSANRDTKRLVSLGKTSQDTEVTITTEVVEAEHIIIFGGVLHHMIAGYGGGRKYIFPGVAGYHAIQQNHSLTLTAEGLPHPHVRQAQLADNPVNQDIEEACTKVLERKTCSYISLAVNGEGEIFHFAVGDLQHNFLKSCNKLDEICTAPIKQRADFVLCSAGGHRTDGQLYQSVKALFNGVEALKEGGSLLLVAECAEGFGNQMFGDMLKKFHNNPGALGHKLAATFDMPSYIALRVIDLLAKYNISLLSQFSQAETEEMGFLYVQDLPNYVKNLRGKGYVIPFAENILPLMKD